MAAILTSTMTKRARVTVAQYSLYDQALGELVPQKAMVLKGLRDKAYVKKQLLKTLGPDVECVITGISAGEHVYAMSMADFIRLAPVVDGMDANGNEVDPGAQEAAIFGNADEDEGGEEPGDSGDGDGESSDEGDESEVQEDDLV